MFADSRAYPSLVVGRLQKQLNKADEMGLDVTAGDLQPDDTCDVCGKVIEPLSRYCMHCGDYE